jgi:hypothetical protein
MDLQGRGARIINDIDLPFQEYSTHSLMSLGVTSKIQHTCRSYSKANGKCRALLLLHLYSPNGQSEN